MSYIVFCSCKLLCLLLSLNTFACSPPRYSSQRTEHYPASKILMVYSAFVTHYQQVKLCIHVFFSSIFRDYHRYLVIIKYYIFIKFNILLNFKNLQLGTYMNFLLISASRFVNGNLYYCVALP